MTLPAPYTVALPILAKGRKIPLGTSAYAGFFSPMYNFTLTNHFQRVTPEVEGCFWYVIEKGWGDMDALRAFAAENRLPVHYHCLRWCFGAQPEDWRAWIREAMGRYPGIVDWTVVNEGWGADNKPTIPDIPESFEEARAARADARLWYNGGLRTEFEQAQAQGLVMAGLADGIGFQMHHWIDTDVTVYRPLLEWLWANRIPWKVTELDVCIPDLSAENLAAQARAYQQAADLVREYHGEELCVWGVSDLYSWKLCQGFYPLPIGLDWLEKPAWDALDIWVDE